MRIPESIIEPQVQSFLTRGVTRTVLPNNLTLITKELHDKPVVASIIWYRVGSRNEELGQTGKSHFLEHMLFKGTDRYEKGEIDLITLKNGGSNNAFTWLDFTAYYFTFASDRWQAALEIEASRMRNTRFAREEFESEKRVVEEELRIGLDGPWEALENEVWATAFRQHPYHWPTVGWLEDLEAATAEDMKAYYDKWYNPQNATLVIVGDFNTSEVVERVAELFGPIQEGTQPRCLKIVEPPQRGEKRVVVKKETPVERLLVAYHAPAVGDADSYGLQIAETLLSTGKTSRLYRRLVERDESVTFAKASYHDHIDPSLFYFQAELKPGFKLEGVERAIYEEIERLKNEQVSSAELSRAKRQIEAGLVLNHEDFLQQAILLGEYETIASDPAIPEYGRGYKYLDALTEGIRSVGAEDVARVARKYLTEDNRTVGYLINEHPSEASDLKSETSDSQPQISDSTSEISDNASFRTGAGQDSIFAPLPSEIAASRSINREHSSRPRLEVERFTLSNGLTVLLSENHTTPSVSINTITRAGSRFEPDEKAGLASLVGELLDEGTETRTSDEIAESVESVGGRLATFGEYQESGVRAAFLSQDISLALDIVADLLMNATFPEEKVRQHIERRAAQLRSRLDVPRVKASDLFNEIIFKGHPQHRPSVGLEETVRQLTREDMVAFYRRFYVPEASVLAIVGDIDPLAVKTKIEELFSSWSKAEDFETAPPPPPARQTEPIEMFVAAPKEQVNIFIGHTGIERNNADYYRLLVLDTILGSSPGFTSRIPRILRDEQGLAYSTFSNITASAGVDAGRFVAYIGTAPENLEKAVSGLRHEIARIVHEPVTIEELETAKAYLTGNFVFDFQTNSQIAGFLVDAEIYSLGFDYLEKYPEMIRAVTIADITEVARKYLDPERLTTVVVGPVDERGNIRK